MAAKEPVACETEDSITSQPDLPCQDTGHIVSMPQTSAQISKYRHCLKNGMSSRRARLNNLNKKYLTRARLDGLSLSAF